MLSEKESKNDKLIKIANTIIGELVYSKDTLKKAYSYYEGERDPEQFRYLEENYGLGNPTSLTFTPLIRKHIDALVGEFLNIPVEPKISCKDEETLNNIMRDKQLAIYNAVYSKLNLMLQTTLLNFINGQQTNDPTIQYQIDKLKEDIENNFTSEYEIAAQNIIEYLMQSREVDFKNKLRVLLLDLLIAGECYFKINDNGENIEFEVLSPLDTFPDRDYSSNYIKDSHRLVCRKYMTKSQIISYYNKHLSKTNINDIKDIDLKEGFTNEALLIQSRNDCEGVSGTGIMANYGVTPGIISNRLTNHRLVPVYEVEWKKVDKDGVMQRYEVIRIGGDIYVVKGVDENIIRNKTNPSMCTLNTNGLIFKTRGSKPYSLMLATMDQQDKYDILLFIRDNLIANSGSVGDWVDVSKLPTFLGIETADKLQKWLAYKKQGIGLLDSTQEGMDNSNQLNTIYSGYDDTIKGSAIQAIELIIERIENTCSSITGMFRERIGGIQQRDAVSNVEVGVAASFNVTKQYFQQMDILVEEILTDSLNTAKQVYPNGITGSIILGDKLQKVFTALPKHYTITDFDVHVTCGTDIIKEIADVKILIMEFIKSGALDPDILIDAATSKSLTEMKIKVNRALRKKKEENNVIQQLQQQAEQLQQQLKQLTDQNSQLNTELKNLNSEKIALEQEKVKLDNSLGWFKERNLNDYQNKTLELKEKQINAEILQLRDGNAKNDEISNII